MRSGGARWKTAFLAAALAAVPVVWSQVPQAPPPQQSPQPVPQPAPWPDQPQQNPPAAPQFSQADLDLRRGGQTEPYRLLQRAVGHQVDKGDAGAGFIAGTSVLAPDPAGLGQFPHLGGGDRLARLGGHGRRRGLGRPRWERSAERQAEAGDEKARKFHDSTLGQGGGLGNGVRLAYKHQCAHMRV